ncbi:MAG: hypothetical protein JWO03_3288, partial [Bacteroidetes bacterium]|nr:hypothetical protein [Bacteroidota bacterium]
MEFCLHVLVVGLKEYKAMYALPG